MSQIIVVNSALEKMTHILDDSGRLHWDRLCADMPNTAGSWFTSPQTNINDVSCPRCVRIWIEQNEALSRHGLQRPDAGLLYRGLSEQANIKRGDVEHLIYASIFSGNSPTVVINDEWVRCELTEVGREIAIAVWVTPYD
jgi:hypothetical protein